MAQAAAARAQHPQRMGLIQQQGCAMALAQRGQGGRVR